MKQKVDLLFNKLGILSNRTKNISNHILFSFFFKGGSILTNLLLVPLTVNLLDTENYGIWLTLSSFISWFSFFDIGLGNGLRNKFAEAKAKGDLSLARAYVSTAYFTVGIVCLFFIFVFGCLNFLVDWTCLFNTKSVLKKELNLLVPIIFTFFCLQLIFKLISTIYTADQDHSIQGKVTFYSSCASLFAILILSKIGENSLLIFGIIYSAVPLLLLGWLNVYAFSNRFYDYRPSLKLYSKYYLNDIFGLGMKFFIIQISGIILFSSDNIIISQLLGPKEVVPFNIVYKYFSISNMIISIILAPFWSTITEAYTNGEFEWLKLSMKNLNKISFALIIIIFLMILCSSSIYKYWIGNIAIIPYSLTISVAIYFMVTIFYSPYTVFINGVGKIKLQMYSIGITALINIPLSILIVHHFAFGVSGVVISNIICLLPYTILCPIQYWKIVNKKAYGIWNQ